MENSTLTVSLTVAHPATSLDQLKAAFGVTELLRLTGPDGSVIHAEFIFGGTHMYISVGSPDWKAQEMPADTHSSCLLCVHSDDPDAAYQKAITAGMTSIQEPQDQIWGYRTAIVADPDGYRWNLRKEIEKITPQEAQARADKLFAGS